MPLASAAHSLLHYLRKSLEIYYLGHRAVFEFPAKHTQTRQVGRKILTDFLFSLSMRCLCSLLQSKVHNCTSLPGIWLFVVVFYHILVCLILIILTLQLDVESFISEVWCLLSPLSLCVPPYTWTQSMLNTIFSVLWPYLLEEEWSEVEDGPEGCPALLLWQEGSLGQPSAHGEVGVGVNLSHGSEGSFLVDSRAESQSFYFRPQELFGKTWRDVLVPQGVEFSIARGASFLAIAFCSLTPKAESQQLCWFASFLCWF